MIHAQSPQAVHSSPAPFLDGFRYAAPISILMWVGIIWGGSHLF